MDREFIRSLKSKYCSWIIQQTIEPIDGNNRMLEKPYVGKTEFKKQLKSVLLDLPFHLKTKD